MIELSNVNKIYSSEDEQVHALTDINLSVEAGEIFGVIGKSGAGKSTLIRCVNLLERPSSGTVTVFGKKLTSLSPEQLRQSRLQIGMVFQHFNLLSSRTVYRNIALPLELQGKDKVYIKRAVMPLLELIGLKDRENAYPSQLSGGQKQRVAIARALATKQRVLLCDEITSALDPVTTASILDLLKEINEEMRLSILFITHEMEVIKSIADKVAVIDQGKIVEQSDVVSLFKNPQTDIARQFTQSIFKARLPHELQNKMQHQPIEDGCVVMRIAFIGHSAAEPVIDDLIRHCNVRVNVLQANLEFLHHDTIGMMVVAAQGNKNDVRQALDYLSEQGLGVEVLGYVVSDDWTIN